MTKLDRDLAGALKTARQKSMHFALVLKAPGEGTLIVSKNPVSGGSIAQAKQELGGGQIIKGRCVGGPSGQLVFETAKEPAANLAKTLKAVIARDAGLNLKIETRRASDLVDEEDEARAKALEDEKVKKEVERIEKIPKMEAAYETGVKDGLDGGPNQAYLYVKDVEVLAEYNRGFAQGFDSFENGPQ